MAVNTTTTLDFLLNAARDAFTGLRRGDGDRAQVLRDFLSAQTDDERDDVVALWGGEVLRRSLRVTALSLKKDEETANVFWTLRDMIDVEDDTFNADLADDDSTDVLAVA
jgi:hypothetical protein